MKIDFNQVKSYYNGKAGLIAGLCQEINLQKVYDQHLEKNTGRPVEIPYGSLAQMMLINVADDHHPLSRLDEYFENVDLESLLGHPVKKDQLNDDRFGGFLDAMHEAGCEKIYSAVSYNAFKRYGIKLSSMNFDTTSKVMWGEYQTEEGTQGVIDISFGYSKQKRFDKKQMKFSLGTSQGICIDGQVLSGNLDDKTYNLDNLPRAKKIKDLYLDKGDDFFYIADSAAFTKKFLQRAQSMKIDVITRMTDNLTLVRESFDYVLKNLESLTIVEIPTSTKPSIYKVHEDICEYHGVPLKMAVCYSEKLRPQKERTIEKRASKELKSLTKIASKLKNRDFACEEDARLEIEKLTGKDLKKIKYHKVLLSITQKETRRRGRPSKNPEKNQVLTTYLISMDIGRDEILIQRQLDMECLFVVASTKLSISASEILKEYKTQSAVERKFQFMKSAQFIDSFYLDSPRRIEALGYILLILMLLLSVAEFVVRRELEKNNQTIIGPGKKIMARPSMIAIYRIFYSVVTTSVTINGVTYRGLHNPLKSNVQIVLRILGIPEKIYYRGPM